MKLVESGRKKWLILVPIATVFVVVGGIYVYMQKPSRGIINNDATLAGQTKGETTQSNTHYTGSTVSFDYPGDYGDVQKSTPSGLIAEQLSMIAHAGFQNTRRVSVTVKQLGSGVVMAEDAAYKLRALDTTHKRESTVVDGKHAVKFTKQDNSEITYFVPGSGYYVIISGTATNGIQKLTEDLNVVTGSFKWSK